jgi:hypothetical protein
MKKSVNGIILLAGLLAVNGCLSNRYSGFEVEDYADAPVPWTHLEANNDPDKFQFVLVGDRTGGMRPGVFSNAMHQINLMQPEFVASIGDLIPAARQDKDKHVVHGMWDEFDGLVQSLDMPFFYVAGNHDCFNPVQGEIWAERLGPSFYDFVYKDVHFVVLNSQYVINDKNEFSGKHENQVAFLKGALEKNSDSRWTVVLLHHPLWNYKERESLPKHLIGSYNRWLELEQLLSERKYTVFAGHVHKYTQVERNGSRYYTLATTGGGSKLRGVDRGEFDHFFWITMTDDGPVIASLLLDGVVDPDAAPSLGKSQ